MSYRWRRGWDSNPITSCRFCNLQKLRCRDCQECRRRRGALHLVAPAGGRRAAPPRHPDHRRSTLPDLTRAARASSACSSSSTASPKPQPTSCARTWMRPKRALTLARTSAGNVSNSFATAFSRICSASGGPRPRRRASRRHAMRHWPFDEPPHRSGQPWAASACSLNPSAAITLRTVSKSGLRSPERAL